MIKRLFMMTHGAVDIKEGRPVLVTMEKVQEIPIHIPKGMKIAVAGAEPATLIDMKANDHKSPHRRQEMWYRGSLIYKDSTSST